LTVFAQVDSIFVEIEGTSRMFNEGSKAVERFQWIHTGVMSNLTADCFYECYVGNPLFMSSLLTFSGRTPDYQLPYEDYENPASIVLFGDLDTGENAQTTKLLLYEEANSGTYDAIANIGDFAYDLHHELGEVGDIYLRMIEPVASHDDPREPREQAQRDSLQGALPDAEQRCERRDWVLLLLQHRACAHRPSQH
jgi:hypothetical protein